ncbi:MFS transporter [Patescibacteria group bacterium]
MRQKAVNISKGILRKEPNYVYYWLYFLRGLGFGFVAPIYTVFLFSQGFDAFQASLINLVFVLGNVIFQIPAGALADAWGRRKTFLVSSIFHVSCFFIYAIGKSWQLFVVAELFSALGFVLMTGILEAWVVDRWGDFKHAGSGKSQEYGFLFSRAETAANIASIFGGLAGALVATISLRIPLMLAGLVFLAIFFISLNLMEEKWEKTRISLKKIILKSANIAKIGTKTSLQNPIIWRVALFASLSMMGFKAIDMFWSKRFFDLAGSKVWVTGYIWVFISLFMIVGNNLIKIWADKKKDYLLGFKINIIFASLMIFLSTLFSNFYPAVLFFLFYEITRGVQRPGLFGYFNKVIKDSEKRATILSFSISTTWFGGAIGLLTLGWLAKQYSIELAWQAGAVILLLSLVPITLLKNKVS